MSGLIIANLLAEETWARRSATPNAVTLERLGLAAGLLSLFARDSADVLWIPPPIPLLPWRSASDLPQPHVQQERPAQPARDLLAWAATAATDAWRPVADASDRPDRTTGVGWLDDLWALPLASGAAGRRLASRAWTLALARRLGVALPGARMVADESGLTAHLAAGGARGSLSGSWVLKAPWSAAGRQRIVVRSDGPSIAQRRWMRTGFIRPEGLLFEPWMARRADFGCVGLADHNGVRLLGAHNQVVDAMGRFQGLTLWPGCRRPSELPPDILAPEAARRMDDAATAAGRALAEEGYAGPFGVDAWTYVDVEGRERFQPLGELNVRCTMGLVALAGIERLRLAADGRPWRLRFGSPPPPERAAKVLIDTGAAGAAWLEPG